jgi:hypothetical protein
VLLLLPPRQKYQQRCFYCLSQIFILSFPLSSRERNFFSSF